MFFPSIWIVYVTLQLLTDHVVRFGLMVVREIFVEALWTIVRIGLLDPMDTYADLEPSIAKRTVRGRTAVVNGVLPGVWFALLHEVKVEFLRHGQLDPLIFALVRSGTSRNSTGNECPTGLATRATGTADSPIRQRITSCAAKTDQPCLRSIPILHLHDTPPGFRGSGRNTRRRL